MEGHYFDTVEKYNFGQDRGDFGLSDFFVGLYLQNSSIRKSKIIFPNF